MDLRNVKVKLGARLNFWRGKSLYCSSTLSEVAFELRFESY